ncbi:Fph type histidine kinase [Serpula lacrymans var. lacrymans S7.9]|uniref:dolichol kinase n=1 Tax=Serpula lacrymans var. lacrymans (strain S7.9) TaxID=578457 RepID=F8NXJ0_SERL9|nr:Fph type histidine kinase [Serpula lacrymans var. lacrymans S7.9]EGO24662.1 Fph type histidine kinase [Serpula lacrymans var. lacrymans S7.9]
MESSNAVVLPDTSSSLAKLPRSHSSPSPPSSRNAASGRSDTNSRRFLGVRSVKRRHESFGAVSAEPPDSNVELSTTYHAGSSSSASGSDTAEEDTDEEVRFNRGRSNSQKGLRKSNSARKKKVHASPMNRTLSPVLAEHIDVKPNVSSAAHRRQSFTRSRSPHVRTLGHNAGNEQLRTSPSPRVEARENRRHTVHSPPGGIPRKSHFSFAWMTVPKNYRESSDDGILTGFLLGPIIASAMLYSSLQQAASASSPDYSPLPRAWRIEEPRVLLNARSPPSALDALVLSRESLVNLATFCSFTLLSQVCASWWFEARCSKRKNVPEGERGSVPRSELLRTWNYILFTYTFTLIALGIRAALSHWEISIWQHISYFDIIVFSLFYQFCLYIAIRLAHRGFTLGELALVCFGGLAICTELLNLTRARIWPVATPFIKTYRLPTPLLIFQIALVAGSFLTGFLLSPLLVLSRHIAQKPVHRLRFPQEKQRHRRALAAGFYIGTIVIVGGLIGAWTWWSLGRRDPWLWTIFWLLEGRKKWSRPMLLVYWGLLGSISVAAWNRQLSRSRRYRPRNTTSGSGDIVVPGPANNNQVFTETTSVPSSPAGALGLNFPNLPNLPNLSNLPNSAQVSNVATDLLDAADKHVPTLGLNARRKFFHALAVVMFLPGVAFDPAFTHLSFSAAFALFTFAEYVRYFAIYPFGAVVHLFMNEFLDHKDSGTAILSHFYLLTGCAGSLWLEGPHQILQYTGILALGVGDALASIVGKRIGKHRWSPSTSKTLEGSAAFTLSIVACVWILRICGLTEDFSIVRYTAVVALSSALEALSDQNDNLTLPLYMWKTDFTPSMEHTSLVDDHADAAPSLSLNGISLSDVTTPPNPFSLPIPRLTTPKRVNRRPPRPSTASGIEEVPSLLPSILISQTQISPLDLKDPQTSQDGGNELSASDGSNRLSGGQNFALKMPVNRGSKDTQSDLGVLSPPFDNLSSDDLATTSQPDDRMDSNESDYDWATFMDAYASGRWHPHRTPTPPRSFLASPSHPTYIKTDTSAPNSLPLKAVSSAGDLLLEREALNVQPQPSMSSTPMINSSPLSTLSASPTEEKQETNFPDVRSAVPSAEMSTAFVMDRYSPRTPSKLSTMTRRFRKSFTDMPSASNAQQLNLSFDSGSSMMAMNPDVTTAAATMRWAAARVNLAPLALPSPEHELTDPMRGVHTAIPGSHPLPHSPSLDPMTPGGTRKTRLGSFWEGTQDIEDGGDRLYTIAGSPSTTPPKVRSTEPPTPGPIEPASASYQLPPATAPLLHQPSEGSYEQDYFGDTNASSARSEHSQTESTQTQSTILRQNFADYRRDSEPLSLDISTVPALPRRICLTRQTSSPLPQSAFRNRVLPGGRTVSEPFNSIKAGRAAKEEQMFQELGYLAPPNPPDELERRRALYKFNIWNTGPDLNFDRIAHLAKLVFNTKSVFVSLIDGNEQWFKSQWGMDFSSSALINPYFRGDEPTVVLDTHTDWRFAKNPLVLNTPKMRFYAGAPLRTQDGFNIGSLAVIDDQPRQDFTPRQRHTLKEFAAIAMREMELWRDKIQLRIRDRIQNSMEQFSRECLEIDAEIRKEGKAPDLYGGGSMDKVYDRAAKLVKRTLDVEGVIVMDVSHCEVLETMNAEGSVSVVMHYGDPQCETTTQSLTADEYSKLNVFFNKYPDGKISEGILPICFRPFIPTHIEYALSEKLISYSLLLLDTDRDLICYNIISAVPIFNIDKRPFALLCAYNASDPTRRFLEGHELSYLRAIGVIILSAVLKRRMMLADQAKSLFISNISHELRTPLHGILAAAELLAETPLNHSQISFLHTVQACGTSLVETVNHVLDFTKLSGNVKSGGVDNVIVRSRVDMMQLVEEAIDGCWIGHCARTSALRESEIGSVYSPPTPDMQTPISAHATTPFPTKHVEIVIDIDQRPGGWTLICEKGGIRRVLMNLFGNSLKFTSDGYIHVSLRQSHEEGSVSGNSMKIELAVTDTGKGINQNFLKNHLFHPFSQENPLQPGTGLGLAIVNSIVQSPSIGGKVDVSSEEGVGTEIKITFEAEQVGPDAKNYQEPFVFEDPLNPPTVSLVGFRKKRKGIQLVSSVICTYLTSWWGFKVQPDGSALGDIVIINEDPTLVQNSTQRMERDHMFILLSSSRGSPRIMGICGAYERIGGFCRILYKPGGPSRLRSALKHLLRAKQRRQKRSSSFISDNASDDSMSTMFTEESPRPDGSSRQNSGEHSAATSLDRDLTIVAPIPGYPEFDSFDSGPNTVVDPRNSTAQRNLKNSTVTVGAGGTLLKSSIGSLHSMERRFRMLIVEDNSILRNLLAKWLSKKGYDYQEAVDGQQGVNIFEQNGPFDVVLLDLSMPVLDGVGATVKIREIETDRSIEKPARILALTGMSSLEDKRKAFEAGMDGYLVKPVAFKTLDEMFHKLGLS